MPSTFCDEKEAHPSHMFKKKFVRNCSGITECGQQVHALHSYSSIDDMYCPGICNCIFIRGIHGPGEHK